MSHPLIVAHRMRTGRGIEDGPENARSSLKGVAAAGADLAEIDIRLSLDRQPVVLHDAMLGRTSRGRGWVGLWPSAALRRLPLTNGSGERISLLRPFLMDLPAGPELALHLKDRRALQPVLRLIEQTKMIDRIWLWLEHATDVRRARDVLPGIRCTLLRPGSWDEPLRSAYFADAQSCGATGVSLQSGAISASVVHQARSHDLLVFTRIDDDSTIGQLMLAKVGGVITDDPAGTRQAILEWELS